MGSTAFAVLGFIIGLTFTIPAGNAFDLGYHLIMLPILITTLALLLRRSLPRSSRSR